MAPSTYSDWSGGESKEGWHKWEWLLLPLLLAVSAFQVFVPWFREQGMIKLFLAFMGLWIAFGTVAVAVDDNAGSLKDPVRLEENIGSVRAYASIRRCRMDEGIDTGDSILGKMYIAGIGCTSWIGFSMFEALHLTAAADWVEKVDSEVREDFWIDGRWSGSYVMLGAVAFLTFSTLPLWLLAWLLIALAQNINISWGS